MPFSIVRNDITHVQADAIVNTANPQPIIGAGVDSCIHEAAGHKLLTARQKIGRIDVGSSVITPAFNLQARYVIHTVGPVWRDGTEREEALLRSCYDSALALAKEHKCKSVAFPLISSGTYRFPKGLALQIAIDAIRRFLLENEMQIYLVVYDREAFHISESLFSSVSSYIDDHYVEEHDFALHPYLSSEIRMAPCGACAPRCASVAKSEKAKDTSLEQMLKDADMGFSQALLQQIDRAGLKDSDVYKKANIDRKLFSKIRNNPSYQPKKTTAVALAMALELNLQQTNDLLRRAGFALSHSSKFDIIVEYFITQKNYDLFELDAVLFEFDQPLLCG